MNIFTDLFIESKSYSENMENALRYYFENFDSLKEYSVFFHNYIYGKCIVEQGKYPTKEEIERYLNKEISFAEIKSWQEELASIDNDKDRQLMAIKLPLTRHSNNNSTTFEQFVRI